MSQRFSDELTRWNTIIERRFVRFRILSSNALMALKRGFFAAVVDYRCVGGRLPKQGSECGLLVNGVGHCHAALLLYRTGDIATLRSPSLPYCRLVMALHTVHLESMQFDVDPVIPVTCRMLRSVYAEWPEYLRCASLVIRTHVSSTKWLAFRSTLFRSTSQMRSLFVVRFSPSDHDFGTIELPQLVYLVREADLTLRTTWNKWACDSVFHFLNIAL